MRERGVRGRVGSAPDSNTGAQNEWKRILVDGPGHPATPDNRLAPSPTRALPFAFHLQQELSRPILEDLYRWLREQIAPRKVEPNSTLGGAINYLIDHWAALTLLLRVPGAPLDDNLCERGLKMAIMHRKNSLSYKTKRGAWVGDLFMSLIHTCRLNAINPFEYLVALARHRTQVARNPDQWLPWTYAATVACDTS